MPRDARFQDATIAGTLSLGAESKIEGNVIPDVDDLRTLGDSAHYFDAVFVNTLNLGQVSGTYNVKAYGATGNGTTDDTTSI